MKKSEMQIRKVLVTGGTGFIGAALVKKLVELGRTVRVFDNDSRGSLDSLKEVQSQIEIVKGDIRDEQAVIDATAGIDTVYHLAFVNGTRYFYEVPELVLDVGVRGSLNTLKAAIEQKVRRYILASSSEVYQTPEQIPTQETERIMLNDITNPRYSYAGGKIISELLTLNFLRKEKIECVIFRPHNIYGPAMGFEHVIPEFMTKIACASDNFSKNEATIEIQGTGKEARAFCYIENAVSGIILCGERGSDGEIYHLGEMNEIAIIELLKKMGSLLGIKVIVKTSPLLAGSTPRRCPDTSKLTNLGYSPIVAFTEGLRRTIQWYKNNIMERKD